MLTDHDNTLPVDLDNALAVDSLIHLLKEREFATLTEMLPRPGRPVLPKAMMDDTCTNC